MDLKINANLVRRWQKELQDNPTGSKLVPVQITTSAPSSQDTAYIELSVADVKIKVVGNIDSLRIAEIIRALR